MGPITLYILYGLEKLTAKTVNINPKEYAPESPIKNLAGGKLNIRKDKTDPSVTKEIIKVKLLPKIKLNRIKPTKEIKTKPPDNPSIPS